MRCEPSFIFYEAYIKGRQSVPTSTADVIVKLVANGQWLVIAIGHDGDTSRFDWKRTGR